MKKADPDARHECREALSFEETRVKWIQLEEEKLIQIMYFPVLSYFYK